VSNPFGIPSLDTDLAGVISKGGYGYTQRSSMERLSALRGRPRYRLRDTLPSYVVSISIEMTDAQFNAWQTFWSGPVGNGVNQFTIRLTMDSTVIYEEQDEAYVVKATSPWSAENIAWNQWRVRLSVEVPNTIAFQITICDVIYGGPIDVLAVDDIYGGPITSLAEDVIEPCERVLDG